MSSDKPSLIKRLQQEIDELIVQLDLGKAEALEYVEKHKGDLREFVKKARDTVSGGDSKSGSGSSATASLRQKLDELRVQLALGKMESKDALEEQRKKIHSAIDEAKHAFEPVEDELKTKFTETSDSLKTKLDALALHLGMGKIVAEEELKSRKDRLKTELEHLRENVKSGAEKAGEAVVEAGQEAKSAFDEIRSNLRQLFR